MRMTEFWGREIAELEAYFEGAILPTLPIRLNEYCTITNCHEFVESHLKMVKANNGRATFLPYLTRLQELRIVLTANMN